MVQALAIAAAYSLLLAVGDVASGGRITARMQVGLAAAILFKLWCGMLYRNDAVQVASLGDNGRAQSVHAQTSCVTGNLS